MSSAADFGTTLNRLYATILQRRGDSSPDSYTARLFSKGRRKIAQKVGEEAIETALAAGSADDAGVVAESADLLYHLCVLWADCGLTLDDIAAELARREGVSGLAEKASRKE